MLKSSSSSSSGAVVLLVVVVVVVAMAMPIFVGMASFVVATLDVRVGAALVALLILSYYNH